MSNIENIKLTLDINGILKKIELKELGKINVICGKNNAGKSTLLLNIQNSEKNLFGISLKQNFIESIEFPETDVAVYEQEDENGEITYHEYIIHGYDTFESANLYKAKELLLEYATTSKEIFWDKRSLESAIKKLAVKKGLLSYEEDNDVEPDPNEFDTSHIKIIVDKIFGNDYKPIYIQAKRNPSISINLKGDIDNNSRFIKYIFEIKNSFQNNNTKDKYQKLIEAFHKISGGYFFCIFFDDFYKLTDNSFQNIKNDFSEDVVKLFKSIKNNEYTYREMKNNVEKLLKNIKNSSNISFNNIVNYLEKEQKIVLYFSKDEQNWISASESGLGFRDLLYILGYAILLDNEILLLEEPENHLSPDVQRALLKYLRYETDKQYFITTHSNVFLDSNFVDNIFHVKFTDTIEVSNESEKANLLKDLGYLSSDNLYADVLILVEGTTDVDVLEVFIEKLDFCRNADVKILGLGGVTNMPHADLSVFKNNYGAVLALVDGDNNSNSKEARKEFKNNCVENNIDYTQIEGYGIENYFTISAFTQKYLETILPQSIDKSKDISEQIPSFKKKEKKENIKPIAQAMTKEEIENTGDLYEFLVKLNGICLKINK